MSKYAAKIDNGLVTQVIRGDADWAADRLGGVWLPSEDKVGQGWEYDAEHGFRHPQPYPSWTWADGRWNAPVPVPDDGDLYMWDEPAGQWVLAANLPS